MEMVAISSALDACIRTHQDIVTRAAAELCRCLTTDANDRIVASASGCEPGMLNRIIARTKGSAYVISIPHDIVAGIRLEPVVALSSIDGVRTVTTTEAV